MERRKRNIIIAILTIIVLADVGYIIYQQMYQGHQEPVKKIDINDTITHEEAINIASDFLKKTDILICGLNISTRDDSYCGSGLCKNIVVDYYGGPPNNKNFVAFVQVDAVKKDVSGYSQYLSDRLMKIKNTSRDTKINRKDAIAIAKKSLNDLFDSEIF